MWDSPRDLRMLAMSLTLAAAVLLACGAIVWTARQPVFALRQVIVDGNLARTSRAHLETVIREELKGTFFTLSLADARASLERVPWVKSVALRRQWPDRLEVTVVEHQPLARWNDTALVDTEGEEFSADFDGELPQFTGPEGSSSELATRFREFSATLAPCALTIAELQLSPRGGWRLRTVGSAALSIELGRNEASERLSRYAAYQQRTVGALVRAGTAVDYVDLRYRNGFAVRVPEATTKPTRKMG
jgi:cell division protein FtsQ